MNPDKQIILNELLDRVNGSPFIIVFDYTGVNVTEFSKIRQDLADSGAECHVAKNNFMRKVIADAGLPDISEALVGQTAFITGSSDVVAAAKALTGFIKTAKKGVAKIGILDGAIISAAQITELGNLPSRETLLAMLLGTINGAGSALARVIQAYVDKSGEGSTDAE